MASGDSLGFWDALSSRPPGGGAPMIAGFNNDVVMAFEPDNDNTTYFFGILPASYSGGNIEVNLFWNTDDDDTADDIKINVAFERRQPGTYDFDNGDSFGTDSTSTITVSDEELLHKTTITITAADAGTPVAGEPFRFRVVRDADDVADTYTSNWYLVQASLTEA